MVIVTSFEITEKSTGDKVIVSRKQLQKKLKPADFEHVAHEVGLWGTWENKAYIIRSRASTVPGVTHMIGL